MASVATGPSKPSFQCLYLDGSVRKSTRTVSPSAMSCLPRATGLSQNDPERLGPLRAEILPAVRRAAVEQRAVTGLEQVAVAVVVQGDLAVDHVEELHLAALDDDLLGRDPALLGPERRDDRADLALEEPGAQHRPALRRAVEADDGVVLPAGHHDRAGGLAAETRADRPAGRRRPGGEAGAGRVGLGGGPPADGRGGRGGRGAGLGGDRADDDPGVADDVALHPDGDGDAEPREIERAAPPELQIRGAPAVGGR